MSRSTNLKYLTRVLVLLSSVGCAYAGPAADARASAVIVESEWIKPTTGHTESRLGAIVENVTTDGQDGSVIVEMSLPNTAESIEEIVVIGHPDAAGIPPEEIPQPRTVEVLRSTERSGIVIHLPKLQDFVLRINYTDSAAPLPDDMSKSLHQH
jgi:hypothetical protein